MSKDKMKECPECKGKKKIELYLGIRPKSIKVICGLCNGTGKVTEEKYIEYMALDKHAV